MPNKPSYYARANLLRRRKRRPKAINEYDAVTFAKEKPSLQELRDALRNAKVSSVGIIRLAALMDNLSAHCSPRFVYDGDGYGQQDTDRCRGRTSGIRKFLSQDGYLVSRYSTLMRYKRLAEHLRKVSGIDERSNLLWGLEPSCPPDYLEELEIMGESGDGDYGKLRKLYASLSGMNFKGIEAYHA